MATITIRRGYYILNWADEAGRHRKSLGRVGILAERDVRRILQDKQLELSTGAQLLGLARRRSVMFGQYAREYLHWHSREFPDSHYRVEQIVRDHLLPRFEFVPLDMLAVREVEHYKHERLRHAATGSVIKELRTLKAIVHRAVREGLLSRSPIDAVCAPRDLSAKPHRFYEADELQQVYAACVEPWHAAAWKLYANTGMRRMEGLYLRRRNLHRDRIRIVSSAEERTKSGEWRDIPLTAGAREALERLPREGDRVLPQIEPESLSRAFIKCARRAELDGSLHTLRHTYISHLVRAGVPLRTVQIYAGHAHYTTTEHYAYLQPGTPPEAVSLLSL